MRRSTAAGRSGLSRGSECLMLKAHPFVCARACYTSNIEGLNDS